MVTERGAVMVDGFKQNLTVYSHAGAAPDLGLLGLGYEPGHDGGVRRGDSERRQPRVTGMDGYRAVEATLAAYELARIGQPVQVS